MRFYSILASALSARINAICRFPSAAEDTRIVSGLRWIEMFSNEVVEVRGGEFGRRVVCTAGVIDAV